MSALPGHSASISVGLERVRAALGALPPALCGALAERFFQLTDNHRRAVLKYNTLPSGKYAQRFLAPGLHRYGAKKRFPTDFKDLQGESFAAAGRNGFYGDSAFSDLEYGATKTAGDWFAVPILAVSKTGGARHAAVQRFIALLKAGELTLIGKTTKYLVAKKALARGGKRAVQLLGVLVKGRLQPPELNFYNQWEKVYPKHLALMEADIDLALTEAGRESLLKRVDGQKRASEEYGRVIKASLAAGVDPAQARAAAKAAALAVRARGTANA